MDNRERQKMTKRTELRANSPENTMPVVLITDCQTIASNLLETTRPLLLQESMIETGDALPHKSVMEQWLFMPLPEIKLTSHKMN